MNESCAEARARPSAEFSSSTEPYASTRGSVFGTRRPYMSEVSPSSPVFVAIDILQNANGESAPADSPFNISIAARPSLALPTLSQGRLRLSFLDHRFPDPPADRC